MPEYSETYHVTREMHMRPYSEIARHIIDLRKRHAHLEVYMRAPNGELIDATSVVALLTNEVGTRGTSVEVRAAGDLEVEILRDAVTFAGRVLTRETEEKSWASFRRQA